MPLFVESCFLFMQSYFGVKLQQVSTIKVCSYAYMIRNICIGCTSILSHWYLNIFVTTESTPATKIAAKLHKEEK